MPASTPPASEHERLIGRSDGGWRPSDRTHHPIVGALSTRESGREHKQMVHVFEHEQGPPTVEPHLYMRGLESHQASASVTRSRSTTRQALHRSRTSPVTMPLPSAPRRSLTPPAIAPRPRSPLPPSMAPASSSATTSPSMRRCRRRSVTTPSAQTAPLRR